MPRHVRKSPKDAMKVIELASKAVEVFREEQKASEIEPSKTEQNVSGYLGEIEVVVRLLDFLTYLRPFEDIDKLQEYLTDHYIPSELRYLSDINGKDYNSYMKDLYKSADAAVRRMEDETLQLRIDNKRKAHIDESRLMNLRESLCSYYGKENDEIPPHYSQKQACEYRRKLIFRKAGSSLRGIYDLRSEADAPESLLKILDLAKTNIETCQSVNPLDYKTLIGVTLALSSKLSMREHLESTYFEKMAELSKHYYFACPEDNTDLDRYLFLTLFNWPRCFPSVVTKHLFIALDWPKILAEWKDVYYKKYPRQRLENVCRKKDTVLFFLGSGEDMTTIAQYEEFRSNSDLREEFWTTPIAIKRLYRSEGILIDGTEVKIKLPVTYQTIHIPTSYFLYDRTWWNKRVYFVVGFSFAGPKAYDVNIEKPSPLFDDSFTAEGQTDKRHEQEKGETHIDFLKKLESVNQRIIRSKQLKKEQGSTLSEKDKEDLLKEENALKLKRDNIIKKRKKLIRQFGD